MKKALIDRPLLVSVLLLVSAGFLIFMSASLGLLTRDSVQFGSIAFRQVFFGLVPGLVALYAFSKVDYMHWRRLSFWLFILAILLNLAIFIPGAGITLNGATRWLHVGSLTLQVSEFLKIGSVMFFATWLAAVKEKVTTFKHGLLPLLVILGIVATLLRLQPDNDTLFVISSSLVAMFIVAGAKWRHVAVLAVVGVLGLALVAATSDYVRSRIVTYLNPAENAQTTSYQIQQSLIAIGSGGVGGRGFGQSIQKFNYLPEPVGDSIFAVAAEEFGLVGSVALISLFVFFALRCFSLAGRSTHPFGSYLMVGIATFMIVQSFVNIGSMIGLLPIAGIPLLFVSQGGTALLFALAEAGILLNVSRYAKMKRIA